MSMAEPHRSPPREEEPPEALEQEDPGSGEDEEEGQRQVRAPWHFKLIAVGTVIYLGYRAYQGVEWLSHHIH